MHFTFISLLMSSVNLNNEQKSTLYKNYYKLVYRTVYYYVKNVDISKELTNEAFITSFEKYDTLKDVSKYRNWICRIASNLAKQYLIKNKRLYFIEDYENLNMKTKSTETEVLEKFEKDEIILLIRNSLNKMNGDYKEILILRYYNKLSYKEISNNLDLNMGTVKNRLHRAKKVLCRYVEEFIEGDMNA